MVVVGGGGIGFPPSAVRTDRRVKVEEPSTVDGGGGIGLPPSASNILAWLEEAAEWCAIGPGETTTNANTANKHIFRKFISPPDFGKWFTLKLGYGENAARTTSERVCLPYRAARSSPLREHL